MTELSAVWGDAGVSAWGQEWAWASEIPLGAFSPLDAHCSRTAEAELPQNTGMRHCLWLQCIVTHSPTFCLSLTPFLSLSSGSHPHGFSGTVTLLSS